MRQTIFRKIFFHVISIILIAGVTTASAANDHAQVKENLRVYFQQLTEENNFSGSVLVAQNGKVLLEKGFGMADYVKLKANNRNTIFKTASLGKAFTSMCILILEERGLLSVNDTIADHIPEFPGGEAITLHQLMTHTSGLLDFLHNPEFWLHLDEYHTPDQMLEYFMYEPLTFEPGTSWSYCNSGFITLGVIIERISGMSYRDFIRREIFEPLGMRRSGFDPDEVDFPHRQAVGYDDITSDPPLVGLYIHPTVVYAAGGHYSTVDDMFKWDRVLNTEQLVAAETLERMFTPGLGGYGYGWYVDRMDIGGEMHRHAWHWGDYPGFHTFFSRLLDDDVTIIIMCNTSGVLHTPEDLGVVAHAAAEILLTGSLPTE